MNSMWKIALCTLCMAFVPALAMAEDVISTPDDATATDIAGDTTQTTAFNTNPCWDAKCPEETAACQTDTKCNAFVVCGQKPAAEIDACYKAAGLTEQPAQYQPMAVCGWKACADPTAGSCVDKCGKWDNSWPCNCDDACTEMGDCCSDLADVCVPAAAPTCKDSGCDAQGLNPDGSQAACYCDTGCAQYGDCCEDIAEFCGGGTDPGGDGLCAGTACDGAGALADGSEAACYCDGECEKYGDCCSDYETACKNPVCVPACDGKACGPDGCGATCGTCTEGACDILTGQCKPTTEPTDTIGTDITGGSDAIKVDTKSDTTTPAATATSSSSGGCSSTGTPVGQGGLLLALFALIGAVVLRRRIV